LNPIVAQHNSTISKHLTRQAAVVVDVDVDVDVDDVGAIN
jgi:hypothetical protein